jgi:hypothetical protein
MQWRARLALVEQYLNVLESTKRTECNWRGVPLLMSGRLGHVSACLMLLKRVFDKRDHGAQHSDCDANGIEASCCSARNVRQKRGNEEAGK